jgi:FHS family glucose/mannose:H+ symporter-like MFS transporter
VSTKSAEIHPNFTFDPAAREWLAGFLLVGTLLGLLGSLLIAWQYHLNVDPRLSGLHFLGLNAGYVVAASLTQRMLARVSIRGMAMVACTLSFASLLALSLVAPPVAAVWRIAALAFLGAAGGTLMTALLYLLEPYFEHNPAALSNLAGVLFGCGCLLATCMVAVTYFASSVQIQTALLALMPLIFLSLYAANKHPAAREVVQTHKEEAALRETLRDLRSVAAVLFSLLLFFQFGNEWAIAGWLPLFLIHRLGSNPVWAIFALAVYFLALMIGRIAARPLLARVSHRKLLILSIVTAIIGYLILSYTRSMAGAWIAVIVIGAGFAPIYPLIAETLDDRFHYHAGFYSGLFSIAITGGMCMPWVLGYVDAYLGAQYVMLVPALGSIAVLVLALLIMLEARMMGAPDSGGVARATAAGAGKP